MLLNNIEKSPDNALNICERRVNNGSPSNFTEQFLPRRMGNPFTCSSFHISTLESEASKILTYGELPKFCIDYSNYNSIFVHPDLSEFYPELHITQTGLEVIPTSSSRTVKVVSQPFYLKLCYPDRIGRVTRELDERHIYSSLEVTERFDKIVNNPSSSVMFAFMPERGGMLFIDDETKIGMVIRQQIPFGKSVAVAELHYMIPGFSLFSIDRDNPEDSTLLLQLLDRNANNKENYLLSQFCYPLIDVFFDCVMLEGIIPEMHAQNVLFGFDDKWNLKNIILRDMESHDKDITLMKLLNKPIKLDSYPFKCIEIEQYNYAIKHSFMFDHKLGEYFIAEIIKVTANGCENIYKRLSSAVKQYVLEKYSHFINDVNFFPADGKWYKFQNAIIDRTQGSRPYDILDNPLFR
jgi:hypothetical protein